MSILISELILVFTDEFTKEFYIAQDFLVYLCGFCAGLFFSFAFLVSTSSKFKNLEQDSHFVVHKVTQSGKKRILVNIPQNTIEAIDLVLSLFTIMFTKKTIIVKDDGKRARLSLAIILMLFVVFALIGIGEIFHTSLP